MPPRLVDVLTAGDTLTLRVRVRMGQTVEDLESAAPALAAAASAVSYRVRQWSPSVVDIALVMREAATRADELLAGITAAEAPGWAAYSGFSHALRGVAELWAGRPDVAAQLLAQAVESYPAGPFNPYGAVYYGGLLALAQAGSGRLALARGTARAFRDTEKRRQR